MDEFVNRNARLEEIEPEEPKEKEVIQFSKTDSRVLERLNAGNCCLGSASSTQVVELAPQPKNGIQT